MKLNDVERTLQGIVQLYWQTPPSVADALPA